MKKKINVPACRAFCPYVIRTLTLATALAVSLGGSLKAADYFVAPTGDDHAEGTRAAPWKTIRQALTQLSDGDTLNLRSAEYFESGLRFSGQGTADRPIVLQTDPADLAAGKAIAVVDGSLPAYHTPGKDLWERAPGFSPETPVYRTRARFPGATWINAWVMRQDTVGATIPRDIALFAYGNKANLQSAIYVPTVKDKVELPLYIGPGVHLGEDGHVYIRLTLNPHDKVDAQRRPLAGAPYANSDYDPNQYRIALAVVKEDRPRTKGETYSYTPAILTLAGAAHVKMSHLAWRHANAVMRWDGAENGQALTYHIELDHCVIEHGESGLLAYGARDCQVTNCEFDGATPDWLHWRDVKGDVLLWKEAFPEFQSFAINGVLSGFVVANNLVHQTMDGLLLRNRTVGAKIMRNLISDTHDDAVNLDPNVKDVEIGWNVMRHCHAAMSLILPFGISSTTDEVIPEAKGDVFIHHNVMDLTRPHPFARQAEGTQWSTGSHFASHGHAKVDAAWKIYSNTIIGVAPEHKQADLGLGGRQLQTGEVHLLNNLFYSIGDRPLLTGVNQDTGAHYDGNAYRRAPGDRAPLFAKFGDGGTYPHLADFIAQQAKSDRQPRWETNSIEFVDDAPGGSRALFNQSAILAHDYDPRHAWDLYRPQHRPELFTAGAGVPADWPGAAARQRGAVGSGTMPPVGPQ